MWYIHQNRKVMEDLHLVQNLKYCRPWPPLTFNTLNKTWKSSDSLAVITHWLTHHKILTIRQTPCNFRPHDNGEALKFTLHKKGPYALQLRLIFLKPGSNDASCEASYLVSSEIILYFDWFRRYYPLYHFW